MNDGRLIAFDCDGTVFDESGYPSQFTCDVLRLVVDSGHHIVAATGRSRLTACQRLAGISGLRYIVCSNGAYAWDVAEQAVVWQTTLTQPVVAGLVSRLRNAFVDVSFGWETIDGIGYEKSFIDLAGGIDELESGGMASDPWSQDLYKLLIRRPGVVKLDLLREVQSVLGEGLCEMTTSGAPFVEITALGSDKGTGLERTSKLCGITAANTIVFGDNYNDVSMLRWAGLAIAMGNAPDDIQAEADDVSLSNTEHGVASYLKTLHEAGKL